MEKIKVGEYIRTDRGVIYEYTEEEKNDIMMQDFRLCNDGKIVKHRPNIIDLVCEGDYVNGRKIERIVEVNHKHNSIIVVYDGELWNEEIKEEDIEDVVTHEQFNQVKYEV